MDLLSVANNINAELGYLRQQNPRIISEIERAAVFDSIVTGLVKDILDAVEFKIVDRQHRQEICAWGYDLRDKNYMRRQGPPMQEIAVIVKRGARDLLIECLPVWSIRFQHLDAQAKAFALQQTVWAEDFPLQQEEFLGNPQPQRNDANLDLSRLELELRRLEEETKLLDKKSIGATVESTNMALVKNYITGIQLMIFNPKEEQVLVEWGFVVQGSALLRQGPPVEQIIGIAQSVKRNKVRFVTKPIISLQFQRMSPKEQVSAMSGSIWEKEFSQLSKT